tara:strand:+ start:2137 stop:2289 length:153 start_codon:yes stop_codon:yes gene_type:complete
MEIFEVIELLNLAIEEENWKLVEECVSHLEGVNQQDDTDLGDYFSIEEEY